MTSAHPAASSHSAVALAEATFNPDVRKYWLMGGSFPLNLTSTTAPMTAAISPLELPAATAASTKLFCDYSRFGEYASKNCRILRGD